MFRRRSDIWKHFNELPQEKEKCSYCSDVISVRGGSVSNLTRHSKRKHHIVEDTYSSKSGPSSTSTVKERTPASVATNREVELFFSTSKLDNNQIYFL